MANDIRCIICHRMIVIQKFKQHMRKVHEGTVRNDPELRHYLYSLKMQINVRHFICTQCHQEFPNNREYYTHHFKEHRGRGRG